MKYYRIDEHDLRDLLSRAMTCDALECGGVDNWYYYCDAIHEYVNICNEEDGTSYEDIDEIVESVLSKYEECTCE
jgi:hypothetical protein